jgi:murein L,D-transpeptidase YafK
MMTRAWLILADILVTVLLFVSLILFYLYPVKSVNDKVDTGNIPIKSILLRDVNIPFDALTEKIEQNVTMSWEEFMHMAGEDLYKDMYREEISYNKYLDDPLDKRLKVLSAKEGDSLFLRIFKKEALLEVWINSDEVYRHLKDYRICAYSGELGPKEKEGDKQSPEGFYKVKKHHLNPNSKFHLSFNLGYPNDYDKAHKRTGSFLMVHGNCVSIGCYAMTDEKIEEIYALVEAALDQGQKYVQVHIYPFRMTEENMVLYDESKWYDFWVNLKEGYDYFESEHLPPYIKVEKKHYSIKEAKE